MHLSFKPGTQFRYSGEGINLVQFLIEQQKQRPLHELMQESLFAPLGMSRTGMIYRAEFAPTLRTVMGQAGSFCRKPSDFRLVELAT